MARSSILQAILTAPEAARRHKLSRRHIVRLVATRKVSGRKAEGAWLVDAGSLRRFLSRPRQRGRPKRKK